ncbi:glutaredoxin domain-containing protein [Peptoniphilus mikwangii]|uniref:glutaredoxin domain-containing protein n=1 Tax=Peptoniphilus mikwangii TaxID=1354300 RepID=UPI000419966D|nr:glutaredoxin domain-containing protein [Peptoniphilus mikwangii]
MITVFISGKCPDCPPAIQAFENSDLDYDIIDITENMSNLKKFLKYRDFHPYFDAIKASGKVGIPTIMIGDGEKFIEFDETLNLNKLK